MTRLLDAVLLGVLVAGLGAGWLLAVIAWDVIA